MTKVMISKHSILLVKFARHDDSGIVFKQQYDDAMPEDYLEEVKLDPETWRDLGEPEVITLSIEPGDKLNFDV